MKALILDDVPLMRKVISSKLAKLGVDKIIETGDPKKALLDFKNETGIKLVISDYRMPTMNGSEFFQKVYQMENSKKIKSVLISGIEDLEVVETYDDLKVDYYLSKTDLMEKLEEIVNEAKNFIPEEHADLSISIKELTELCDKEIPKIDIDQNMLVLEFTDKKVLLDLPEHINITKK